MAYFHTFAYKFAGKNYRPMYGKLKMQLNAFCNPSMLTLLFSHKLFRILLLKKIICYRILNGSHTNVVTSGGHVDLPRMQRVAPSFSVSRIILVFLLTILMLVGTSARNIWEKMRGSAERVRFALFSAIHVSRNSVMG